MACKQHTFIGHSSECWEVQDQGVRGNLLARVLLVVLSWCLLTVSSWEEGLQIFLEPLCQVLIPFMRVIPTNNFTPDIRFSIYQFCVGHKSSGHGINLCLWISVQLILCLLTKAAIGGVQVLVSFIFFKFMKIYLQFLVYFKHTYRCRQTHRQTHVKLAPELDCLGLSPDISNCCLAISDSFAQVA